MDVKQRMREKVRFYCKMDTKDISFSTIQLSYVTFMPDPETPQEAHNQLAWLKRILPNFLNNRRKYIALYGDGGTFDKVLPGLHKKLETICYIYDKNNLPLEDFCQVAGINVANAKYWLEECCPGVYTEMPAYLSHLNNGIESEFTNSNRGFYWNRNGMPLFELCNAYFIDFIVPIYKEMVGEDRFNWELSKAFDFNLPFYAMNPDGTMEEFHPRPVLMK